MSGKGEALWKREGGGWRMEEKGTCRMQEAAEESGFWNSWVFSLEEGGALSVAHARRGEPQSLVNLIYREGQGWRSEEAHLCGRDEYACQIRETAGEVVMFWDVRGPEKNYRLVRRYRSGSGGAA